MLRFFALFCALLASPAMATTGVRPAAPTTVPSSFAGNLTLSSGVLTVTGSVGGVAPLRVNGAIQTTGATGIMLVTGAASTGQTAGTEIALVDINLGQTVTWAQGALTTERAMVLRAPTLAFAGASTVTNAATFDITGAPVQGTNATLTNAWALRVEAGASTFGGNVSMPHVVGNSATPTSPTAGTGCGTSSAPTNAGTDLSGNIGVTCGTTGTANNAIITVTFVGTYASAPRCVITPANSATALLAVASQVYPTSTTTTLAVTANASAAPGAATYLWNYTCTQ
jgi:hypothetical protein